MPGRELVRPMHRATSSTPDAGISPCDVAGDPVLLDQMLAGLNLNTNLTGSTGTGTFGAVGTVNAAGVFQSGAAHLRRSSTFQANLANGDLNAIFRHNRQPAYTDPDWIANAAYRSQYQCCLFRHHESSDASAANIAERLRSYCQRLPISRSKATQAVPAVASIPVQPNSTYAVSRKII